MSTAIPDPPDTQTRLDTLASTAIGNSSGHTTPVLSWFLVATLTAVLTCFSTYHSIRAYQELRSGWSWDLAYYNQWFWALTEGDATLSVRPVSAYAQEGPSIWKMNYLAPIRLALAPIYRLAPGPITLLLIQNVMFWWTIPAAFTLVRSETDSELAALSAAALVPFTPLFWPLVWNDFRELQLAAPFVLWAVQGIRSRSAGWATLGIAGMLACRQEYSVMVATFAFVPSRDRESLGTTLSWRRTIFLVGLLWLIVGFFGYLKFAVGSGAPGAFIEQFMGPKAPFGQALGTSLETLVLGMGAWAIFACLAPRVAILALPWIWGPCSSQWAMRLLATSECHNVRYVMPMAAIVLAAGLLGYARLANWLGPRRRGRALLVTAWVCSALFCGLGLRDVAERMSHTPIPIDREEVGQVWAWIHQVAAADAVMVDYELSAPLSSRHQIYGCELDANLPKGFPKLGPEFHWLFIKNTNRFYNLLLQEGFEIVHHGKYVTVARRGTSVSKRNSDFFPILREHEHSIECL
jgi:Predicted membrane protein (DUF2079)